MPRVLYSFPYRIGHSGICSTAWHQVDGASRGGSQMILLSSSDGSSLTSAVVKHTTLSIGCIRLPLRYLGRLKACGFHDWVTSCWLKKHRNQVDLIHGWPLSSVRTIQVAKRFGIPFLLERPNVHTAQAFETSTIENKIIGIELPPGHDHEFNKISLKRELKEYDEADYILCPSEFVVKSFRDRGFENARLIRHHYGFDESKFIPGQQDAGQQRGLVMLYVGSCEPRKGLHYALRAWFESGAHHRGKFVICGAFIPNYAAKLKTMLDHPSVEVLGLRKDIPDLMRTSDLLVLSSVEEGSALVTYEARASGCVLMVSEAAGAVCTHMLDAMVHGIRDWSALAGQIRLLDEDRTLLRWLRTRSLATVGEVSWSAAGKRLSGIYDNVAAGRIGGFTADHQ